jgi:hypothetical protein
MRFNAPRYNNAVRCTNASSVEWDGVGEVGTGFSLLGCLRLPSLLFAYRGGTVMLTPLKVSVRGFL